MFATLALPGKILGMKQQAWEDSFTNKIWRSSFNDSCPGYVPGNSVQFHGDGHSHRRLEESTPANSCALVWRYSRRAKMDPGCPTLHCVAEIQMSCFFGCSISTWPAGLVLRQWSYTFRGCRLILRIDGNGNKLNSCCMLPHLPNLRPWNISDSEMSLVQELSRLNQKKMYVVSRLKLNWCLSRCHLLLQKHVQILHTLKQQSSW